MSHELAVAVTTVAQEYGRRHGYSIAADRVLLAYLRERVEADLAHHTALAPADIGALVRARLKHMPNALA